MSIQIFGVQIEISFLFLCGLTLFVAFDRTRLFIPLAVSVTLHEVAHLSALIVSNCKIRSISFAPGRLGVEYDEPPSQIAKLVSLIMGPASNLLLACLSKAFGSDVSFGINLILFFFNMLPVYGLDGGSILECLLSGIVSRKWINKTISGLTLFTAVACVVLFFILAELDFVNYSLIIFAIYLIIPFIAKKSVER